LQVQLQKMKAQTLSSTPARNSIWASISDVDPTETFYPRPGDLLPSLTRCSSARPPSRTSARRLRLRDSGRPAARSRAALLASRSSASSSSGTGTAGGSPSRGCSAPTTTAPATSTAVAEERFDFFYFVEQVY
jgi:hypothetical protein